MYLVTNKQLLVDIRDVLWYSGAVLESLGDESTMELRKEKFAEADTDNDGWITYDEFLSVIITRTTIT